MKTHRIIAILAFALSVIGGALVAMSALVSMDSLSSFLFNGLTLFFALGAILGGWLIYIGLKRMGGMIALVAGIIIIGLTGVALNDILIVFGGFLGLVAAEMKPWWAFWR